MRQDTMDNLPIPTGVLGTTSAAATPMLMNGNFWIGIASFTIALVSAGTAIFTAYLNYRRYKDDEARKNGNTLPPSGD